MCCCLVLNLSKISNRLWPFAVFAHQYHFVWPWIGWECHLFESLHICFPIYRACLHWDTLLTGIILAHLNLWVKLCFNNKCISLLSLNIQVTFMHSIWAVMIHGRLTQWVVLLSHSSWVPGSTLSCLNFHSIPPTKNMPLGGLTMLKCP